MRAILAYDTSQHSRWAAEALLRLPARALEALEIVTVGAQDSRKDYLRDLDLEAEYADLLAKEREAEELRVSSNIEQLAQVLAERWAACTAVRLSGNPVDQILARVEASSPDLLAMGSRGESNIRAFLFGSVSRALLSHARCPVMVVKSPPKAVERVLVPVDSSEHSARAIGWVVEHLDPSSVSIDLVHVWTLPYAMPPLLPAIIEERWAGRMRSAGFDVKASPEEGDAAEAILDYASHKGLGLIVMGSGGRMARLGVFGGGVAWKVLSHAERPVVVVR